MPYKDRIANKGKIDAARSAYTKKWKKERPEHWRESHRKNMAKYRQSAKGRKAYEKYIGKPGVKERVLEASRVYYHGHKDAINNRDIREGIDLNSDRYIKRFLANDGIPIELSNKYPEIIEVKRLLINIKRQVQ